MGITLQHVARKQHEKLVTPQNVSLLVHCADAIGITVVGDAKIRFLVANFFDEHCKIFPAPSDPDGESGIVHRECRRSPIPCNPAREKSAAPPARQPRCRRPRRPLKAAPIWEHPATNAYDTAGRFRSAPLYRRLFVLTHFVSPLLGHPGSAGHTGVSFQRKVLSRCISMYFGLLFLFFHPSHLDLTDKKIAE